ncbi:vacuolar fusion protein ccz1 [Yamadazyma tenuis]|uniref:CCZ1/INTU/HSP4 first Longin domain-containing protein n=1 Tax=Candida tenuis (strain ATCC 10573 / BCRC 21748 / CBS 615 / JCM 9827 / NBRC 10315 / NRRL Y-1498 / VKM Y-70) TaxID=590646 RepID=G3B924_CANTC|nr:uncharacterized protein CANTEDRAFT_108418 [Yamadazyma tenuis ATCC 10573]EGV62444.1 hypothetical protein CANTEDRAFT_108418 [Yamadazyma tenuis ATCC 10573]WEJ93728.1 vacuolar fusion protein ccz1 [Yamadazyma tenuis]
MSSYLSQLVPRIPLIGGNETGNDYLKTIQGKTPKLKYITIFNPEFITGKGEENEDLLHQIFCFISDNNEGDDLESNKVEQVRIIGLVQAMEGLSNDFNNTKGSEAHIINASKSTIIVKSLEGSFTLACSISMPEDAIKQAAISQQMINLIDMSYDFFKLLNTSFANIMDNYNSDILRNLIKENWSGFFQSYNSENFKFPPTVKWPNSLNYKGFLGFFDSLEPEPKLYKKSSIELNYNMKYEIDQVLSSSGSDGPLGVILSCFNKSVPKKYGLIFSNSCFDDELQESSISNDSLIDIYNYLEYYDYHDKLNTADLIKLSNKDLFSSPSQMKENINIEFAEERQTSEETETNYLRDGVYFARDMLNPINLTNNLVISPLNYTMNSMMNMRLNSEPSNWLKIPTYFQFGSDAEPVSEIRVEESPSIPGSYVIGLVRDKTGTEIIQRKLVYLDTKMKNGQGEVVQEEREYSLVIYEKDGIYMTLIYNSSMAELDDPQFYSKLSKNTIIPTLDESADFLQGTDMMESSVGSLTKSINESAADQVDSDFFFVIYDEQEKHIKSSLPYLPLPINLEEVNQADKSALNIRSAMFYLHDQLLDLFFLQKTEFLKNNHLNEYFHKFSTNKINDWMFYYIKYEEKYIIIIRNINHNNAFKRRRHLAQVKSGVSVVSENVIKVDFLDNLGDDVKLWFENYMINGST